MAGGRLKLRFLFPVLLLAAGCASPGLEVAVTRPDPPVPAPAASEAAALDRVDFALAAALGGLVPDRDDWPPREEVIPGDPGASVLTRSIPLSSLAYFPRLRPVLEKELAAAGYESFRLEKYPAPGGETWEVEVEVEGGLPYRVYLNATIAGRVAIIIDDCGNSLRNRELFATVDYPLTLAVLPGLGYTAAAGRLAADLGFEVILHCPMEGINPALDPGPGALHRGMEAAELAEILEENLRELPGAVGVNNHMGSAFTTDPEAMGLLMEELRRRGLFFVDSLTVSRTATGEAAAAAGVSYLTRDVFLDHENTAEFILGQLKALKRMALRRGSAIAIGHDRSLTLEILVREIPSLAEENLRLVPVSDLIGNRGED